MKSMIALFILVIFPVAALQALPVEYATLPVPGEKPEITEIADIPWTPPEARPAPKVIYGQDDRIDVYQETDPSRLAWAASTCALIYTARLTQHADGSYTISSPSTYTRFGLPACEGEPFGSQPTAAYCTGFMVGPDLIVTAGHCYSASSLNNTRFVFGFYMQDGTTPRLNFDADEVYRGVEVISYVSSGALDHSVVRVDRPIRAPGARPFIVRREGVIQPGEYVGVIGHPAGLPMKIAFGDTYVRRSSDNGYFVANLDTYGGNSGSPVINTFTGVLEGILVRGETDYINQGSCFVSNVVPNDGGRGEDVTKATVFAQYVPLPGTYSGSIALDRNFYSCGASVTITVVDLDLAGMGMIAVPLDVSNGDAETLILEEQGIATGRFSNTVEIVTGAAAPDSGVIEANHGDIIGVVYMDEEDDSGEPTQVEATAEVDCFPPAIFDVTVSFASATQAQIKFTTDEPAQGTVRYGAACDNLAFMTSGSTVTSHTISLNGLTPDKKYHFVVEALDRAGNASITDNGGACFSFITFSNSHHFTEYFNTQNKVDIQYSQATYIPIDHPSRYQACNSLATGLPVPVGGQRLFLEDDGYYEVELLAGQQIQFYGIAYDRFFIGSNGYITFGVGDTSYQALPSQHFALPRISALMCDLNPELRGAVFLSQFSDRYVLTFEGVPIFDGTGAYPPENSHTFQIELFLNGMIRITWQEISADRIMVGLSAGMGVPANFASIKISTYDKCSAIGHDGVPHSADINGDWRITLNELLRVIQFYNSEGYSCDPTSPDGFQPGAGPRDCFPHDSDYIDMNWHISLSELLRLIQFYNASGYRPYADSEDGFQPIP